MTDLNPLVAPRVDSTTWYSGIGLAETIAMTVDGIRNESWIDVELGQLGIAAETTVWVLDPVGALVAAGFGFAVEHVEPLSQALDWLAGDPDQVNANAQTWRNVAVEQADIADLYLRAVRAHLPDWEGSAADAYRYQASQTVTLLGALSRTADGMATLVSMSGALVSLVRTLVRDIIGELVSVLLVRIPLWTLETAGTFGLASPYVVSQISALVAKWGARVSRLLRALSLSLLNLLHAITTLDDAMAAIATLLHHRGTTAHSGPLFLTPGRDADLSALGAGGLWRTFDETPGGAVGQVNDASCVSAVGEMLSGRPQADLVEALGSPSSSQFLAHELGSGWAGGYLGPEYFDLLNRKKPWGAELFDGNSRVGHMVIVDGLDAGGRVLIRDPWAGGSTYAMEPEDFFQVWNGNAVYPR